LLLPCYFLPTNLEILLRGIISELFYIKVKLITYYPILTTHCLDNDTGRKEAKKAPHYVRVARMTHCKGSVSDQKALISSRKEGRKKAHMRAHTPDPCHGKRGELKKRKNSPYPRRQASPWP
jgi:hypothetical protein